MVCYNPYKTGQSNPLYTLNKKGPSRTLDAASDPHVENNNHETVSFHELTQTDFSHFVSMETFINF